MMSFLRQTDPEIGRVLDMEAERQRGTINLIASENYASRAVLEAEGSFLTNKYAEGYPRRRYYGGCENVDIAEPVAQLSFSIHVKMITACVHLIPLHAFVNIGS